MMEPLDRNRLMVLSAVLAMMIITGLFGYRLQVDVGGLRFERHQLLLGQRAP